MAKRLGLWGRVRKAVRYIVTGVDTDKEPPPKLIPAPPPVEHPLPASGPVPGLSYENDDTAQQRADRRRLVRQVMEWFKRDGAYWNKTIGRWENGYGEMRSPARLSTVVRNISDFTNLEVQFGLDMSREEWQDWASRIEGYWYH